MESQRLYGEAPYSLVLVHGGPGARGELAGVARRLAGSSHLPGVHRGVLEALQGRYTIAELMAELKATIAANCPSSVALVGYSWGAWLAGLYASTYNERVSRLILISSGPLESRYAEGISENRLSRMSGEEASTVRELLLRSRLEDEELAFLGRAIEKSDAYCPIAEPEDKGGIEVSGGVYSAIWPAAEDLRRSGDLLKVFSRINCPVFIIHGEDDPHPWRGVVEPLEALGKNPELHLLRRCGHRPWRELYANGDFFEALEYALK